MKTGRCERRWVGTPGRRCRCYGRRRLRPSFPKGWNKDNTVFPFRKHYFYSVRSSSVYVSFQDEIRNTMWNHEVYAASYSWRIMHGFSLHVIYLSFIISRYLLNSLDIKIVRWKKKEKAPHKNHYRNWQDLNYQLYFWCSPQTNVSEYKGI